MKTPSSLAAVAVLIAAAVIPACGSSDNEGGSDKESGTEGGRCYGNGSCNPGLACMSEVCVNPGPGGSSGAAGSAGLGGSVQDASPEADGNSAGQAGAANDASPEADAHMPEAGSEPVLNGPCSTPGALACNGHAQKVQLLCDGSKWTAFGSCPADQLCNTSPGLNQGVCLDVVPVCAGKQPGEKLCDGQVLLTCGPDLVTADMVTCPFVCSAAACVGTCVPGQTECQDNGIKTCNDGAAWGSPVACVDSACVNGACQGLCVPGAKRCEANGIETCDLQGQWGLPVACQDSACVVGTCVGECVPGAAECLANAPRTCGAEGTWSTAAPCVDSACVSGSCQGSCVPGTTNCLHNAPAVCSASGLWKEASFECTGSTPVCRGGQCTACPGAGGPAMQAIRVPFGDSFCIDTTEVTRDQYAAWLVTNPSTGGQGTTCGWNTSFTPSCEWPAGTKGMHPVVCVDWCDAFAYCKSVGKRLCGKISGGSLDHAAYADYQASQWYSACSRGGMDDYPYGDWYEQWSCNGSATGNYTTLPVGSMISCECGGYGGVFDMSGNVAEWEDSCIADTGASDMCRVRGGSFDQSTTSLRCAANRTPARSGVADDMGFRCCSDP